MKRVLIVEDECLLRSLIRRVLERAGHDVAEAHDGSQACRLVLQTGAFDLVITDLAMPVVGGLEVIKQVRQRAPHTRIIAMSGCGRSGEPENGLSLAAAYGADLCLHKPVNPGVLLEKVSGLLQTPST